MTDLLTVSEAARLSSVSEQALDELIDGGVLEVCLLDGERRIAAHELARYRGRRDRARVGIERLADVVSESEGGWLH